MGTRAAADLDGYDIIGDVHGCYDQLVGLLARLGYDDDRGVHRHPRRQAVFVGDLMDRGPKQVEVIALVAAMQAAGSAHVIMGNHEFNAIAFATEHPDQPGTHLRPHIDKNIRQHQEFLDQVGAGSADHHEILDWFRTLPLWLDLGDLRVVHACWDPAAMAGLGSPHVDDEVLLHGSTKPKKDDPKDSDRVYRWVEHLCKGPEIELPDGISYVDPGGQERTHARFRWWDPRSGTYPDVCEVPGGCELPDEVAPEPPVEPYADDVPVLFGHYWRSWKQIDLLPHAACVDYSAVKGGPLVAYRWSGERVLTVDHLV